MDGMSDVLVRWVALGMGAALPVVAAASIAGARVPRERREEVSGRVLSASIAILCIGLFVTMFLPLSALANESVWALLRDEHVPVLLRTPLGVLMAILL